MKCPKCGHDATQDKESPLFWCANCGDVFFIARGFSTIEEYIHALEIGQQVEKRLKTEERNRQLWGGKCCGRLRRRRRVRSDDCKGFPT
jgi:hypothetical protein